MAVLLLVYLLLECLVTAPFRLWPFGEVLEVDFEAADPAANEATGEEESSESKAASSSPLSFE